MKLKFEPKLSRLKLVLNSACECIFFSSFLGLDFNVTSVGSLLASRSSRLLYCSRNDEKYTSTYFTYFTCDAGSSPPIVVVVRIDSHKTIQIKCRFERQIRNSIYSITIR